MSKSRSFSIYLLKSGFDASNALKDEHLLEAGFGATTLPAGATLFILDNPPRTPWWAQYFGLEDALSQSTKGSLVFLPVADRVFALSLGHVIHNLKDYSYEYDFGIRVTLNSLDPGKLKSTDILEPGAARRRRTQLPVGSDLTFFDFDRDSTILRSLTGAVRESRKALFRNATGAANLRISSEVQPDELISLAEQLLALYASEDFKTEFPEIQNIIPVKDPTTLEVLSGRLLAALRDSDPTLSLTVPAIINYQDNISVSFTGGGRRQKSYFDVYISHYYDYLRENQIDPAGLAIDALQKHQLILVDEDGYSSKHFSIFKSLVFDTTLDGHLHGTYHLVEGGWYRIEAAYIARVKSFLDPYFADLTLPSYNHPTEGAYNEAVAAATEGFVCLDRQNISPSGQRQIEPCDLFSFEHGSAVFHHVKVSTLSNQLSHLFNQGANAIELLKLEKEARDNLHALLSEQFGEEAARSQIQAVSEGKCQVVYVIISHKSSAAKSDNLPLFSRISLMRNLKALVLMGVPAVVGFVPDCSTSPEGTKRKRRSRKPTT